MSFVNENGVIIVTDDATGEQVLHTGIDKLLHYLNPRIDGSLTRPGEDWAGGSAANVTQVDTVIGALPSVATDIVGLVRFQYSGGVPYLPSGSWYVAGGSFLLLHKCFQSSSGDWDGNDHPSSVAIATIYKNGDQLRYKEQIALHDHYMAGPNLNLNPFTVTYRIFPAVFS